MEAWSDEGGACELGEELVFDAPHLYYDIAADSQLEHDDGTDRFFDVFHPEHEPPGPRPIPQRLLPPGDCDGDEEGDALSLATALEADGGLSAWEESMIDCPQEFPQPKAAHQSTLTPMAETPSSRNVDAAQPSPLAIDKGSIRLQQCSERKAPSPARGGPRSALREAAPLGPHGTVVKRRPLGEARGADVNGYMTKPAAASNSPTAGGKRARPGSGIDDDADLHRLLAEHNTKVRRQASGRAPVQQPSPAKVATAPAAPLAEASAPDAGNRTRAAPTRAAAPVPAVPRRKSPIQRMQRNDPAVQRGDTGAQGEDALKAMLQSHNARVLRDREQKREARRELSDRRRRRPRAGDLWRPRAVRMRTRARAQQSRAWLLPR
ncbi:hypothetical protein T492DRAFT_286435 [Pavlovales sp. CCMP2436]|nr:hypothetical protein T492DRAFT_286435 [Pavlovales sp. CCMP2436]